MTRTASRSNRVHEVKLPGALAKPIKTKANRGTFFTQFFRKPFQLGALCSTSPAAARAMLRNLALDEAKIVVELGPGVGPVTKQILAQIDSRCRFFTVEQNPVLAAELRRRFPGLNVIEGDGTKVQAICETQNVRPGSVDSVVSTLPYTFFSRELQASSLDSIHHVLRPGGSMVMISYLLEEVDPRLKRWRNLMAQRFTLVKRERWVLMNVPPAFVYRAVK